MKISVCTSVLNQTEYLKRMIGSVRAQTFEDWELVIVDDGSTEDIAAVVAEFNDPRIKLHKFEQNKGVPHGLNWAFANSEGEYFQPLSADEWIEQDKFKTQVEYLDSHPQIDCVWGIPGKQAEGWGAVPTWQQFAYRAGNRSREAWIRTLLNLENIPIGGASLLMRRTAYDDIGGFNPELFGPSDLEWYLRFFKKGHKGRILPYRWADADQPDTRLTAPHPGQGERFQQDMIKVRAMHPLELPPTEGKVTVGIPVYNMERWVAQALSSVISQTYHDLEILVLDDCSTDATAAALSTFTDPRIKLLRFDQNRGTVAAINQMAATATGEWFVSLAADDWLEPTAIERMVAEFKNDAWLEFVATQTDFINVDGTPNTDHQWNNIQKAVNRPREHWLHLLYYGNQYFGVGMYRTKALLDVGGWDATYGVLTDYEMYLRLLQRENIKIIEEPLTHTRIHDGNKSLLSPEEGRKLPQLYHDAKLPYYQPRMKVIIATPFYEMRGFSPYIASLAATVQMLTRMNVEHQFWELSGDSYVDRAKNTLFNKFLEDPAATDFFMIDSDMQWEAQTFIDMLMLPEEIVMGSYPQKNMWEVYTARPEMVKVGENTFNPIGRVLPNGSALLKAEYLAGGFIRLKRDALIAYKDHFKDKVYYDYGADPSRPDRLYTEFFACERAPLNDVPMRWGEDRVFGKRMKEIGIESWIYPKANFGHYGIKGWQGNLDTFLRNGQKEKVA